MTVKTTGAEFKRFYNDPKFWPEGAWHEDEWIEVDGEEPSEDLPIEAVPDTAAMKITGGVVLGLPEKDHSEGPSLEAHFKKWLKLQNTSTFLVQCPKDIADMVKDAIKCVGGKVLK